MHKAFLFCAAALSLFAVSDTHAQTLRGSQQKIERVYRQALAHEMTFFATPASVRQAVQRGTLVPLKSNQDYTLHEVSYPYVVPAAAVFVERLALQYRAHCGERLVVTSATRPASMRLPNSTARSVHPTGMAIDLRKPSNPRCLSWLRQTLTSLQERSVIDATEETRPPHFHVAIFPRPYERYVAALGGTPRMAAAQPAPRPAAAQPPPATRSPAPAASTATAASRTAARDAVPAPRTTASAAPPPAETQVAEARPSARPPLLATRAEPGRTYQVRSGDSLWTIAQKLDVSVDLLKTVNALVSTDILAGQILIVPGGR